MKRGVLVTGGAGYIGSHTAVELIEAGYEVIIVDNFSNSDRNSLEGIRKITGVEPKFVEADCCDKEAMRRVFEEYEFDSAIHFAAYKAVGESVTDPMKYYRNNLTSFLNVLELMLFYCIPRKNTSELADTLIRYFGSFVGVMDATAEELEKVPGVGKEISTFLTLRKAVDRYYKIKNEKMRRNTLVGIRPGMENKAN